MTNDYAALVAMLDQAAADLQAEIDAAIDRHGLLVRTANQLRAEADGTCTWPGCEFVSSPSGTGSHMAAHRRRTDGAA